MNRRSTPGWRRYSRMFLINDSITLTPELSAKDVDGWDSLAHIRLILTVEKTFKNQVFHLRDRETGNVGDLVKLIKARA
jgi:acyl carrier protein